MNQQSLFCRLARKAAAAAGHPWAFVLAAGIVVAWAISGPFFDFNDTWQLAINTGTTIVTFLMVFLVQHSQNRDGIAIQVKLDELIRAVEGASNNLIDLEDATDAEIEQAKASFNKLRGVVNNGKTQVNTSRQPVRRRPKSPKK